MSAVRMPAAGWIAATVCGLVGALVLWAAPALASRPHEFKETFGTPCLGATCTGKELKEPDGVAVNEASGDVYVVDKAAGRLVRFDQAGVFQDEVTGPSATGSGTMTEGSTTIEGVLARTGAFSAGEEITAAGLPGGTKVEAVSAGGTSLVVSQAATASETSAELKASQHFDEPETLAVDNSCSLRIRANPALTLSQCEGEDHSNEDVYVVDEANNSFEKRPVVDKFSASGEYLGQITNAGGIDLSSRNIDGVAVDPKGTLWVYRDELGAEVGRFTDGQPNEFVGPLFAFLTIVDFPAPGGLAVDSAGDFYAIHSGGELPGAAVNFGPSGEVIFDELDGKQSSAVAADETPHGNAFVDRGTSIAALSPEGALVERLGEEHGEKRLTGGAGIGVDAETSTLFVADSAAGRVVVFGPSSPSAPKVEAESFEDVGSDRATLAAEINPRSEPGEGPTSYHFDYGVCTTATTCATSPYVEVPDSAGVLSPDFSVHAVSVNVEGLTPGTTYHFRAVASNEHGEGEPGEGQIFTTEGAGGELKLPDNRGWELVSPPDKQGALIEPISETGVIQAAAGGGAITYLTNDPTEAEPQGAANKSQVLSRRGAAAWSSRDIAIPHSGPTSEPFGDGPEYKFFDGELRLSAVQPYGEFIPALSEEASESTAYLHSLTPSCASHCYRPLVSGKAGFQNVPEGTVFGEEALCEVGPDHRADHVVCGPLVLGATEDLSHVVLRSETAALTPGGAEAALTEWSGGSLLPVSVLPGSAGTEIPGRLGLEDEAAQGAISSDGSRIVWMVPKPQLYLRDTSRGETVQLDKAEAGCGSCESNGGRFQIASSDGSRVLFTDTRRLTSDSGAVDGAHMVGRLSRGSVDRPAGGGGSA